MSREILFAFFFTQTFLSGVIAISSFYKYSTRDKLIILVGVLFFLSFLFNISQYVALHNSQIGLMNLIGSFFEPVFLAMAGFIYDLATRRKLRRIIAITTSLFLLGWFVNLFFFQTDAITTVSKLASNLIILFYCVTFFYQLMIELPAIHLHRLPMFWVNSAFLIYSAGTVFLWAFVEYVIKVYYDTFIYYWVFNLALFVLQQLIIIVAIFYDLKNYSSAKVDIR